jgi:protein TonB
VTARSRSRQERRGRRFAALVSLALHGALSVLVWRSFGAQLGEASARVPIEVSFEAAVTPPDPAAVPPPTDEVRAPAIARPSEPQRVRAPVQRTEPVAPSTGEPASGPDLGSSLPVDLTGETLLAVSSHPSAGGSTGSASSGAGVGRAGGGRPSASSVGGDGASDRSGAVSLPNQNWSCPWPPEADAEKIDEVTVSIRVVVSVSGAVEAVTVLSDPGHGFGQAATACALRSRFTPARDREGRPVRATSPPILVRFTR